LSEEFTLNPHPYRRVENLLELRLGWRTVCICIVQKAQYTFLPGMQALLEDLSSQGHQMHVVSNYPVWFHWIEEKLELSRYLAWTFVSCVGPMKVRAIRILFFCWSPQGIFASSCLHIQACRCNLNSHAPPFLWHLRHLRDTLQWAWNSHTIYFMQEYVDCWYRSSLFLKPPWVSQYVTSVGRLFW
jgi:hypothetical protein